MPASPELADVFRENVLRRMKELKISRVDLGERMGCTQGYISQLLGKNPSRGPGLGALEAFAKALETTPDKLLKKK